jgi:ketosteroid isomerase-like protein
MSRENVEVVQRLIEANRSGDVEASMKTAIALTDPSVELASRMAAVEPDTYRGHDGIRRYFSDMADSWKEWRNEVEEISEAALDTVVATMRASVIGKDSGVPLQTQLYAVWDLSNGKVLRIRVYANRSEALEAVGLSE